MEGVSASAQAESPIWPLKLFERSPLKQDKYKAIVSLLGEGKGLSCLDVGSDNGVISYLLRERGGNWHSCDIDQAAVDSIRELVSENVELVQADKLPYEDETYDVIVIVDLLEHISSDAAFLLECERTLKPGGRLIVNVPNPKEGLLRRIRFMIGQTDEAHGHLRPGYSLEQLGAITPRGLQLQSHRSYSRLFSVLIDTLITGALYALKRGKHSQKGTIVTGQDMQNFEKVFLLYSMLYPLISLFVRLDRLCPFLHGNMLIASYRKQ